MHQHPPVALGRRRRPVVAEGHPGGRTGVVHQRCDRAGVEAVAQARAGPGAGAAGGRTEGADAGQQQEQHQGHGQCGGQQPQAAPQQLGPGQGEVGLQLQQPRQAEQGRQQLQQAGQQVGLLGRQQPADHQLQQGHEPAAGPVPGLPQLEGRHQPQGQGEGAQQPARVEAQAAQSEHRQGEPLQPLRGQGGAGHQRLRARARRQRSRCSLPRPGGMG